MRELKIICRASICILSTLLLTFALASPSLAALTCANDLQGVDDEPGQKDLTQWCSGTTADYQGTGCLFSSGFDFSTRWDWDDTGLPGNNTGDACALFDTDGDNKANYALCVDIAGNPASIQFTRLYSCADDKLQRCTNSVLILDSIKSFCTLGTSNDPFGGNHNCQGTSCKTSDASSRCCVDTADFKVTTATLLDVCSYPSQQPNSDPSDCVITPTGNNPCTGVDCNDNNPCTTDACSSDTGACTHTNNTNPCSDGNACTTNDACSGGQCVGGAAPNCDDANVCTTDSCNSSSGCVHVNNTNPCSDGNACTTNDACSGGTCAGGPAPNCDDANVCTTDSCNSSSGCVHVNNTNPCSDGNACTMNDACSGGTCVGGAAPNCDDGNVCTDDSCNPSSGCVRTNNTNPCSDGSACTTNDACSGGLCVGGAPLSCNDGNVCTDDSCNASTGCAYTNNTNPCNDGNACTTADVCSGGQCGQGTAIVIAGTGAACESDAGCPASEVCAATPSGGGYCVVRK